MEMGLTRFLSLGVSAVLVGLAVPAAAQVKIGSLSAVTGPIPDLVAKMLEGQRFAVREINALGGVQGESLEMVIADSQCDAKAAVDAANKLTNIERVTAIVGAVCSTATIGSAQAVAIPSGVVMLSPSSTAPAITDLDDQDRVFRVAPSDSYQGVALAGLALDRGYRKVAMTYANDDYNAGLAEVFRESFVAQGGTIVADQSHEPKKPSYRAELATLARGDADALVLFAYYGDSGINIVRQSLENGFFDKFVGADGMVDPSVIAEIGAANLSGNAVFTAAGSDDSTDSFRAFASRLAHVGGDPRSPYVASSYDAVVLLALALEKAGTTDRSSVSRALRSVASGPGVKVGPHNLALAFEEVRAGREINYEGASGSLDFDPNGDVAGVYTRYDVTPGGQFQESRLE